MQEKGKKFRVGVIVVAPSAQMCGQYDALADLEDYELTILFRQEQPHSPAWKQCFPEKLKYEILSPGPSWIPAKFKPRINANIKPVLDKYDFDALILHGVYDSSAVRQAQKWCRKNNRPYFLRSDGNKLNELSLPFLKRALHKIFVGQKIKNAAGFLTIGENNSGYYSLFGGKADKYFLAPWEIDYAAIDDYYTQAVANRNEIRKKLGIDENTFAVCCVSRLIMRKGYATLIPAVAELSKKGVDAKLFLAGSGADENQIKDIVADCGISVEMPGNLDRREVAELMVASDVFVLVSTHEPWGLVVNEAALCGLPIITSDCVGAAEDMVKQDVNGWAIPSNDIKALVEKLLILANDSELRSQMSAASREIILRWRDECAAINGYKAALDSALADKRGD